MNVFCVAGTTINSVRLSKVSDKAKCPLAEVQCSIVFSSSVLL